MPSSENRQTNSYSSQKKTNEKSSTQYSYTEVRHTNSSSTARNSEKVSVNISNIFDNEVIIQIKSYLSKTFRALADHYNINVNILYFSLSFIVILCAILSFISIIRVPVLSGNLPPNSTDITPNSPISQSKTDVPTNTPLHNVASNLPGTPIEPGLTVSSDLSNEKKRDVFSISAYITQTLDISIKSNNSISLYIIYPNATSVQNGSYEYLCRSTVSCSTKFYVPISDIYYIVVETIYQSHYDLSITADERLSAQEFEDNLPGTVLKIGDKVKSVIDSNIKKRDVYSFTFNKGQMMQLNLESNKEVNLSVVKPGATSIEAGKRMTLCTIQTTCVATFVAANTDTYYIVVDTSQNQVVYTLITSIKQSIDTIDVANNLPGTPITINTRVGSILDPDTKKRDVFSVSLYEGQTVQINIESNKPINSYVIFPEATTVDTNLYETLCRHQNVCFVRYTAKIPGTYYLDIEASLDQVIYSLSIE